MTGAGREVPRGPGALFAKAHGRSPSVMDERMESIERTRRDGSTCTVCFIMKCFVLFVVKFQRDEEKKMFADIWA